MMNTHSFEGGMAFTEDGTPEIQPKPMINYMQSKVGESWLAAVFAKRLGDKKILSVVRPTRPVYYGAGVADCLYRACIPDS